MIVHENKLCGVSRRRKLRWPSVRGHGEKETLVGIARSMRTWKTEKKGSSLISPAAVYVLEDFFSHARIWFTFGVGVITCRQRIATSLD